MASNGKAELAASFVTLSTMEQLAVITAERDAAVEQMVAATRSAADRNTLYRAERDDAVQQMLAAKSQVRELEKIASKKKSGKSAILAIHEAQALKLLAGSLQTELLEVKAELKLYKDTYDGDRSDPPSLALPEATATSPAMHACMRSSSRSMPFPAPSSGSASQDSGAAADTAPGPSEPSAAPVPDGPWWAETTSYSSLTDETAAPAAGHVAIRDVVVRPELVRCDGGGDGNSVEGQQPLKAIDTVEKLHVEMSGWLKEEDINIEAERDWQSGWLSWGAAEDASLVPGVAINPTSDGPANTADAAATPTAVDATTTPPADIADGVGTVDTASTPTADIADVADDNDTPPADIADVADAADAPDADVADIADGAADGIDGDYTPITDIDATADIASIADGAADKLDDCRDRAESSSA